MVFELVSFLFFVLAMIFGVAGGIAVEKEDFRSSSGRFFAAFYLLLVSKAVIDAPVVLKFLNLI